MPSGESMVGYVRVMKDGKVVLYELFAFEQGQEGLVALVRHFGPGLVAREEKDNPNRYDFLEAGDGRALFQKQGEDVRVLYERRSTNEFAIVIGKPDGNKWTFTDFNTKGVLIPILGCLWDSSRRFGWPGSSR